MNLLHGLFSGFARTCLGICLLLWKHQKPKTEAFSKDFLEEADKLLTERSFVSNFLFRVFFGRKSFLRSPALVI